MAEAEGQKLLIFNFQEPINTIFFFPPQRVYKGAILNTPKDHPQVKAQGAGSRLTTKTAILPVEITYPNI
jgi:hypothetical protein